MSKVLGGLKKGLVFVVSAPAGTGKTTLVRMLQKEFDCIVESISYTTRQPRPSEIVGRDYHYISLPEFEKKISEGEFLEYALVFGNYYGTSRKFVEDEQRQGKHVVLVIDTQGAIQLMGFLAATFIFISPPSLEELKSRLSSRKSESREAMDQRLSWAENELALASSYDYHIVNDHLKTAYDVLRAIVIAEEHKNP
jgi:guanylate kinase